MLKKKRINLEVQGEVMMSIQGHLHEKVMFQGGLAAKPLKILFDNILFAIIRFKPCHKNCKGGASSQGVFFCAFEAGIQAGIPFHKDHT